MAKKWRNIRRKFSPEIEARIAAWVAEESLEITLRQIRELVDMSQEEVAEVLDLAQSSIARIEQSADPKLSTIRRYVEALGGKVETRVVFGDKSLRIDV